jgi:hypothetical protein
MSNWTCQILPMPIDDHETSSTASAGAPDADQEDTMSALTGSTAVTPAVPTTPAAPDASAAEPSSAQLLGATVMTLFLDAGLSVVAYGVARLAGATPFLALVVGALVALGRAGWVLLRRREVDPFALFMVGIYVVGLVTSFFTGSDRFLLVKESFGTGAAGLAFLLTCLRGKPLAYHASARVAAPTPEERAEWEGLWATEPTFRHRFTVMSLVIGGVLLAEALVRIPFVYVLPIDVMAVVSPVLTPVVITLVCVWAVHYGKRTPDVLRAEHEGGHTV